MGVIVAVVIFIVIIKFVKAYMSDVYKVELHSITESIKVNTKESKTENILHAKRYRIRYILVRRTMSNRYFREIITGKLIPISYYKQNNDYWNYRHCVYVPIDIQASWYATIYNGICKVSDEDIDKYIYGIKFDFKDFESFRIYLDNVFTKGKKYYKDSKAKAKVERLEKRKELSKRRKFIKEIKL